LGGIYYILFVSVLVIVSFIIGINYEQLIKKINMYLAHYKIIGELKDDEK